MPRELWREQCWACLWEIGVSNANITERNGVINALKRIANLKWNWVSHLARVSDKKSGRVETTSLCISLQRKTTLLMVICYKAYPFQLLWEATSKANWWWWGCMGALLWSPTSCFWALTLVVAGTQQSVLPVLPHVQSQEHWCFRSCLTKFFWSNGFCSRILLLSKSVWYIQIGNLPSIQTRCKVWH